MPGYPYAHGNETTIEVSGGITKELICEYNETGVRFMYDKHKRLVGWDRIYEAVNEYDKDQTAREYFQSWLDSYKKLGWTIKEQPSRNSDLTQVWAIRE